MRIAQLAPLAESVPPKGYGGTELVISQLTEELVRRGHEVVLFASADSVTGARLECVTARGLRLSGEHPQRWAAYEMRLLLRFMEQQSDFDIVHNHMGFIAFPFLRQSSCPRVSTIHNPVSDYNLDIFRAYKDMPLVAISDAYRRLNHPDLLNYVGRVYNAVDAGVFDPGRISSDRIGDQDRQYALFLGRISHAKGTADAIKIARANKIKLKMAGKIDDTDRKCFEEFIRAEIGPDVEYVGEVDVEEKKRLYRGARAVIYPIHFEEPFGLVMVEALASGTPLVALERGSVRELLDDKVAVIASSVEALCERFSEVDCLRSSACVERAKAFSIEKMADGYEEVYRKIIEKPETIEREPVSV